MAKQPAKKVKPLTKDGLADFSQAARQIIQVPLEIEMEQAFLEYAYHVIEERAIPDARDGLKIVQRRIAYSMYQHKYLPDRKHVKSAKIVGDVMGSLHPHGDSAIYEAMVRLAQPFMTMTPIVDGQGNFGSRAGDGAASARYTEARMSQAGRLLVSELAEHPVDYIPTYDQEDEEPTVLPAQYPFLTINGASGIAVGMATSLAPHNPGEVIDATRWLITHPNATLDKLMEFVPGPDFPTGCELYGMDGVKQAYETGKGAVIVRAPYTIESAGRGKNSIIFHDIPYSLDTVKVFEEVHNGLSNQKLQGIAEIKDLKGRGHPTRIVVETKAGVNPEILVKALYKFTSLESNFNFNNVALVEGVPKTLGLKEQLEIFIAHRIEVVTRRTQSRKNTRAARVHQLAGLLKALADIDTVIKIVRAAESTAEASEKIQKKFKIDEGQAKYILDIPLRSLTRYDQIKLQDESKKLQDEIKELNKILDDDKILRSLIGKELEEVRKILDKPRRSIIMGGTQAELKEEAKIAVHAVAESLEVADEPCFIFLTSKGTIVRSDKEKNTKPIIGVAATTTRGKFIAVTNKGRAFRIDAIHVSNRESKIESALPVSLDRGEKVLTVTPVELHEGKTGGIAVGTRNGVVKVVTPTWPVRSDDFTIMGLDSDDEILSATWVDDNTQYDFVFITEESLLLTFPADKVRPQGLSGSGMAGIKLPEGVKVSSFSVIAQGEKASALVVTSTGTSIKATPYELYPQKGRATGGVRSHKFLKSETKLTLSGVANKGAVFNSVGDSIPLPAVDKRRDGSGVKITDQSMF